jgi:hypothetical protein
LTMPFLNDSILATKARGVKANQDALMLMWLEPWMVERVDITPEGGVSVRFDGGPARTVGHLKEEYRCLLRRHLVVQSWEVTGGRPEPGRTDDRGQLLQYFGLNLRIAIGVSRSTGDAAPARTVPSDRA